MDEKIVYDWLADSKSLSPGEVASFASSLKHNNDLIRALFLIFDEHLKFHNLIEPISKQLFNFYRSKEFDLKMFTLQFLPNLIYIYLDAVARGDKKSYHSIETLLIGIYNLEVVDDAGQPAIISFRMPSLAQASIYHEPMSLAHVSLTETALRRLEECNTKLISWGPYPQVETLNAQNRLKTVTKLLFVYNRHIASFNKLSLKYLCKVASSLASQGFGDSVTKPVIPKLEGSKVEKLVRIPVSFQFLLELLCGLYYAMYNDFGRLALEAVDDIYNRSCYECFANVLVVANAIRNSSEVACNGHESEGPMGISVALSPVTTTVTTVNKFMITNASFRTKKLPDDIPIIQKEDSAGGGAEAPKPLTSITEEKEEIGFSLRGSSLRSKDGVTKNLQKLGIGKKFKDKDSKQSSKSGLLINERRQTTTTTSTTPTAPPHATGFKEKPSLKSGILHQNADFPTTEINGHGSPCSSRTRPGETAPTGETSSDGLPEEESPNPPFDNDVSQTRDSLTTPSNNDVIGIFTTAIHAEEKPFTKVSSV